MEVLDRGDAGLTEQKVTDGLERGPIQVVCPLA
jgi:hypothetical protein